MQYSDLDFVSFCTESEGWSAETREVFEGFLAYDPSGCFIAESEGRRIGMCVGVSYGDCGFVGELIVIKEARGSDVGRKLFGHTIQYLQDKVV